MRATTSRDFDRLERLRVVSTAPAAGGSGWTSRYAYNPANQRTRRTDVDGSYWVYEYDALGQVVSGKRFWADGSPVAGQQYEYAYDDIGNRLTSQEGGNDSGQALRSSAYTRNNLNQYTTRTNAPFVDVLGMAHAGAAVTVNGVAAARRGEYFRRELGITNAAGPIGTPTTVAALSGGSSSNLLGTLLSPPANQVLTYDADGNLLSDGLWEYTWDGENRLTAVQSPTTLAAAYRRKVSWEYDAAGRRVRQTTAGWNGTTWTNATDLKIVYDGWACIAELNATNNALIAGYAWGLDLSGTPTGAGGVGGLLWMRPNGGAAHFAAYDGNGNVIGLVDGSTGLESARYEYDTFGNTIRMTGTGTIAKDNPFRFSTKRTERETSLVLYEYRPYSTALGRWPNRDPLGEFGAVNLYSFVLNSPTTEVDLHGMVPLTPVLSFLKDCLVDVLKDKALQPIEEMVTGAQACGALLRELEESAADLTRPCNFCSGVEIKADFKPLLENDGLARRTAKCILNKLTKGAAKKIGPTLTDAERDLLEKALEGKLEDFADVFVVDVHNKVVGKCERGKMTFDIRLGTTLGMGESRFELGGGSLLQGVCGTTFGALHKQCEDCD